jgi:hypothetical protein
LSAPHESQTGKKRFKEEIQRRDSKKRFKQEARKPGNQEYIKKLTHCPSISLMPASWLSGFLASCFDAFLL